MIRDFNTLEERLNNTGGQQNEPVPSIHSPSIQSQLTHAYHDNDFSAEFGAASSLRDQHYKAPTNDFDVEVVVRNVMSSMQQHIPHPRYEPQLNDGNRAAPEPMTPHYEALTTEGCSSVSKTQSKIEKCVEMDAKDDAGNSSLRVATNNTREKRMARRLVKRTAACKSPFVQQCAQEYPRLSPKQKCVADFTLDPKGDEG